MAAGRTAPEPQHARTPLPLETRFRWTAARLAYVLIVVIATLVPYRASLDGALVMERLRLAFRPSFVGSDAVDAVRNLVLFAGWGLVWMLTRSGRADRRGVLSALLSGALLSAAVEALQLFSADRNTTVLDLCTNTAGAGLGAVCIVWLLREAEIWRERRSFLGLPMLLLAGPYWLAVSAEAAFPLGRSGIERVGWGHPLARVQAVFSQAEWSSSGGFAPLEVLLFLPAGFLAVAALVELRLGYWPAAAAAAAGGLLLAAAGEVTHGLVGYPVEYAQWAAHTLGISLGAFVGAMALPRLSRKLRGRLRPASFLLAYLSVLLLWSWRPFLPETTLAGLLEDLALRRWLPMLAQRARLDFYSVADVAVSFFLYLPLGALLAVWPLRRRGWLRGAWPGVYCAFAAELGQAAIATRFFDVSDMLIPFAALAIGRSIVRRAGYHEYGEVLLSAPGSRSGTRSHA